MVILLIVLNVLVSLCLATRFINYIQLDGYKLAFCRHDISHSIKIVVATGIGVILMICTGYVRIAVLEMLSSYIFYLPLLLLIGFDWFTPKKTPTKFTARVVRLYVTLTVIMIFSSIGCEYLSAICGMLPGQFYWIGYIILPFAVRLAVIINQPVELCIKSYYFNRAARRMAARDDIIKIGVTGSYGKTTVKNILAALLSKKYKVLVSPHSYNTPMGFARTVQELSDDTEVVIMEIGARQVGDVKKIADALHPDIAVITGIAPCHLETFGSIDNILKTKYELVDSLREGGLAIFNGSNVYTRNMYNSCPLVYKELVGMQSGKAVVCDLETSGEGSEFTLHIGEESVICKTRLIGEHNIQNILMAVTVAVKLGVSIQDICDAIYELESIPHRLQVIKSNGVTILDDSYNANPVGVEASLRALSLFRERKVVLCQGMVELGVLEDRENYDLGVKMSAVADLVILVGRLKEVIKKGLLDSGYNPTKIVECDSLSAATKKFGDILRRGDVLLIMNDLPDNY